ncbi:bacterio-opsin activator domain-containing protein [Natrarchaeobaculum sulfurireducens]|uniref:Signal-transducing histidine kinase n=1 Tax=Natrarchaeobaculum sulfurireducens TaxID=2044521 RepID=A0A346PV11_9EURY|nr:bacterio-opsin activator domain-containing protein [Natrarchaeobaculum sulfurireducens]AXR83356.1 signal-transducing histidine kinase [Natrarchaeobaculum sulfurireducens]
MSQPITVLVVDNEPSSAELVAEMLERERDVLVVESATSGLEALERIEKRPIDCIVSDYEMPELSGLELLERVREHDPELPFILFTGQGSEELASEAIAAGVTQYSQKTTGSEQYALLANQITNAVSQYRTKSALRESERRYEKTVTTLHEATRTLMRAETKAEIYRQAVETASDILETPVAVAYAFDPGAGSLERTASSAREPVDSASSFERGEGRIWDVFSTGESLTVDGGDAITGPVSRSELLVPLGAHGVVVAGTTARDGFDEPIAELFYVLAANTEAALDRAEREHLLREHDRTLTRKNEELTRLNHINEIVRQINHGIAQASCRSEIESTVCDRLADTDRYRFAWIASSDDGLSEPRAWAGVDPCYLDRIGDDDRAPEGALIERTLARKDVEVVRNVLEADGWDRRRTDALTYGFQTVVAVPLTTGKQQYGVLLVHLGGVDSLDDGEYEVFAELGETIGHAIRSVERTRAMLTDSRLEIELECRDDRLLLNRLGEHVDGGVTVEGLIDRDGTTVAFVSAPSAVDLPTLIDDRAAVESASLVSEGEDERLFELTLVSMPIVDVLRSYDVRLRTARANAGSATLVLEVPQPTETRSLVEAVCEEYPATELVAKRETTRTRSARQLDTYLEERLTDRQLEALQAAHYSGFFEWPRASTGEELADALDVSAPTYHYHLRAAERKLVSLVFDSPLDD